MQDESKKEEAEDEGEELKQEKEEGEVNEIKPVIKVPTLYVRNLNDKIKVEGKFQYLNIRSHYLILTRNASQSIHALFDLRGDCPSAHAIDLATSWVGLYRLQRAVQL